MNDKIQNISIETENKNTKRYLNRFQKYEMFCTRIKMVSFSFH